MAKNKLSGQEKFENFYSEIFGDRWELLKDSLLKKKSHVAYYNPYHEPPLEKLNHYGCLELDSFDSPENGNYYLLDLASVIAANALEVQEGEEILDLCAAPGGKSLILAEGLGEKGTLTCNEKSPDRRGRLKRVLEEYLPEEVRSRVEVTAHDATKWMLYQKNAFDKILLDAPCSSERHVLHSEKHLSSWSKKRSEGLAIKQFSMLASALEVVRVGGRIVYSTCAISPLENDDIIKKLFKKRKDRFRLSEFKDPSIEKTTYGHQILPDKSGHGPIYFAIIERIS